MWLLLDGSHKTYNTHTLSVFFFFSLCLFFFCRISLTHACTNNKHLILLVHINTRSSLSSVVTTISRTSLSPFSTHRRFDSLLPCTSHTFVSRTLSSPFLTHFHHVHSSTSSKRGSLLWSPKEVLWVRVRVYNDGSDEDGNGACDDDGNECCGVDGD